MVIDINNGRKLEISRSETNGLMFEIIGNDGYMEDCHIIPERDVVMLVNYLRNCKSGLEDSDYISKE